MKENLKTKIVEVVTVLVDISLLFTVTKFAITLLTHYITIWIAL
jgi:hypothetical protein